LRVFDFYEPFSCVGDDCHAVSIDFGEMTGHSIFHQQLLLMITLSHPLTAKAAISRIIVAGIYNFIEGKWTQY
jgi:hypothetical protein